MTTGGDGARANRHRAAPATTPKTPTAPRRRRDELDPHTARQAVWFTRRVLALINVTYGLGFVLGAPTESSTYRAMEKAARDILGPLLAPLGAPEPGMWTWGLLLLAAGPLIAFGRIAWGAPLAAAVWLVFTAFNAFSGAYGVPVFAGYAVLHLAMSWFLVRGRERPRPRRG